jgi:hypothetical protein
MAGRTLDGDIVLISVANYARPNDVGKLTDLWSARRQANCVRDTLAVVGTRTAPERTYL